MPYIYDYPRPMLTADCVLFGVDDRELKILLVKRTLQPFVGRWSLPGGFKKETETLNSAARRVLAEKCGGANLYLEQLYTFDSAGRDPRGDVVSVAYYALVRMAEYKVSAPTIESAVAWSPVSALPPLAFDHKTIVAAALERIRAKVRYQPIGFELIPKFFTLSQLQGLYETLLGQALDKRNFRKKILSMGLLNETKSTQIQTAGRPARLYSFNTAAYKKLVAKGFDFQI